MKKQPEGFPGWCGLSRTYLADDVLHLLSVEDVRGVDHSGVGGPVQLCVVLVLGLSRRKAPMNDTGPGCVSLCVCVIPTWLRMSVAFLALMKSGVSVANANIPLPLISCSSAFLYSLCEKVLGKLI